MQALHVTLPLTSPHAKRMRSACENFLSHFQSLTNYFTFFS